MLKKLKELLNCENWSDMTGLQHITKVCCKAENTSVVARGVGSKWGHAPWGAGLGGTTAHFLQSF